MPLNTSALNALREFIMARRAAAASAPEQKMLQGVYRGFAGESNPEAELFAANQKQLAEYYARRRAAQTGEDPHVEMMLIDPNAGVQYGLHPSGAEYSRVRKVPADAVEGRSQLYAKGGHVARQAGGEVFPNAAGPDTGLPPNVVAPGRKRGGLTQIKECACNGR